VSPIRFSSSSLKEGRWYEYLVRFALGGAATVSLAAAMEHPSGASSWLSSAPAQRWSAFAIVFSMMVVRSVAGAFIGASLAWLVVSATAWCVRRKTRSVSRG
jgi:hypothetical protein